MRIRNVHAREIPVAPERAGELLDMLGGERDRIWPSDRWPRMKLDGPLAPGAHGGHGPVRYRVAEHDRGRRAAFAFEPKGLARGLAGGHVLECRASGSGGAILEHRIDAECGLASALLWAVVIRPLHDALIEDALDRAWTELTQQPPPAPARWSLWVRLLRFAMARAL